MLKVNKRVSIPENEIRISAMRSSGPGGQNVNKVASAVHLRFDIKASSLPLKYKQKLMNARDRRISKDGVIVIKAESGRNQLRNRTEALNRLAEIINKAVQPRRRRIPTVPSLAARHKRLEYKARHGRLKKLRQDRVFDE